MNQNIIRDVNLKKDAFFRGSELLETLNDYTILRTIVMAVALLLFPFVAFGATELKEYEPQAGEKPLFAFAAIADPHVGRSAGIEKLKWVFNKIKEMKEKTDFVLVLGDLINAELLSPAPDDIANVKAFKQAWRTAKIGIPIHVMFGNHDNSKDRVLRDSIRKAFKEDLGKKDFYSFKHKSSLFIVLRTAGLNDHVGHFYSESIRGGDQFQWLEKVLRDNAKKVDHIFIAAHIPPAPEMQHKNNVINVSDQMRLSNLLKKYKVTAMFFGHLHKRQRFYFTGVPSYVMRSSNWNEEDEPPGFSIVKVYKNGVQAKFIPLPAWLAGKK